MKNRKKSLLKINYGKIMSSETVYTNRYKKFVIYLTLKSDIFPGSKFLCLFFIRLHPLCQVYLLAAVENLSMKIIKVNAPKFISISNNELFNI